MQVRLGSVALGNRLPLAVIGGINVVESAELALQVAEEFDRLCGEMGIPWIFKASFDKANRSSVHSFRGHGMEQGLQALDGVRQRFGVPLVTDIHLPEQAAPVAEVVDLLQIPAFLCRQTDLLAAAAATGKPLHIKKAQFLAPEDCRPLLEKCRELGAEEVILCERGTSFGYHCLVVDTLGFSTMKALGCPVSFDVTHALQLPGAGGAGDRAGGQGGAGAGPGAGRRQPGPGGALRRDPPRPGPGPVRRPLRPAPSSSWANFWRACSGWTPWSRAFPKALRPPDNSPSPQPLPPADDRTP